MSGLRLSASEHLFKTGTGQVVVMAAEWQMILLYAGQVWHPIYQAYFTLRVMDPIPQDGTDDPYWSAVG